MKIALKYKVKQRKKGKFPSNYKASPIDFETQISLLRKAPRNIIDGKKRLYVNKTYVNGYRQEAKTVTCYGKARCKHRISHEPNLIQVLNAQEVRRLTKIKFDDATSVASSTEPVKSRQKFNRCLLCRIEFLNHVSFINPQFSSFSQLYKNSIMIRRLKWRIYLFKF